MWRRRRSGIEASTIDDFFSSLVEFVKGESDELIKIQKEADSKFKQTNRIILAQPNFCGVGVNLNEVADRLRNWYKNKFDKEA